ncbi:MAG TPA: hypothetical protein VIU41_12120 [Geobacteraceae bacterium]
MTDIEKTGTVFSNMETPGEKTIILWGQDDVLIRAVEDLLITGKGWKVIRVSNDWDEVALAQVVEQVTPDVLIVHESAFASNMRLLIKFVMDYSKLKIITIGLENNQMEIYVKQTICIKKASDLLAVIENEADMET